MLLLSLRTAFDRMIYRFTAISRHINSKSNGGNCYFFSGSIVTAEILTEREVRNDRNREKTDTGKAQA